MDSDPHTPPPAPLKAADVQNGALIRTSVNVPDVFFIHKGSSRLREKGKLIMEAFCFVYTAYSDWLNLKLIVLPGNCLLTAFG